MDSRYCDSDPTETETEPLAGSTLRSLADLFQRLTEMNITLTKLSDRLFGPQPPQAVGSGENCAASAGLASEISSQLRNLTAQAIGIQLLASRLESRI